MNVASPFASQMVRVKFSNTETWDYPAEWGVERIEANLKRRVQELDRKEQAWLATVSESRKAECRAIPSTTPFTDQPADCVRMFFADTERAGHGRSFWLGNPSPRCAHVDMAGNRQGAALGRRATDVGAGSWICTLLGVCGV